MDVHESLEAFQNRAAADTSRPPLVLADKSNGTTHMSRTREVNSRYMSATPSTPTSSRRYSSPNVTRPVTTSSQSAPKRAVSAERKRPSTPSSPRRPSTPSSPRRPSTPSSPRRPSTPVHDTSMELNLASRKIPSSRHPEVLWPSTMRSLSVSFQSDTFSLPISKKEKPVAHALSDRTLKPASNVAQKQAETPLVSRKPTPERKRAPLKGKNATDQSENSKPVDILHARLVDQHRWPSRTGGKVSSNPLNRGMDLADKTAKTSRLPNTGIGMPSPRIGMSSPRRMSFPDGLIKPLKKSTSDAALQESYSDCGYMEVGLHSVDENKLQESGLDKPVSSFSLERMALVTPAAKSQSLPAHGSRFPSPGKASGLSSSVSRGVSPSRTRPWSPASRGVSPTPMRPSSPTRQSSSTTSVLSFIADIRKGKKAANHIEDAHQLRLLYNRHLQWRYTNARADAALNKQKVIAEKALYNVWRTMSELYNSVNEKRMVIQQLTLRLKLYAVLEEQMAYLEEWASIERDHTSSLSQTIKDLQSSILRLPVTGGARVDVETMKAAVSSAVDMMQAMGFSICFILPRVEGVNCLVSELADVAAQERALLNECEALLASSAAMQVEEYSLRNHLIQLKQITNNGQQPPDGDRSTYLTAQVLS
ncbi:AUGMIN subunit 8-like isoform X2 [Diospyros lotus]|uniref:AUGMIN subunit 8-like isoform X2 n=1 Tax=Diospyros lotus TaxID=55363 RepID=UPI002257C7DB|nr:AUGMIN subunit 8-like isoform X2 [Diospyros lotus]